MRQPAYELLWSLLAITAISLGYFYVVQFGIPQPHSVVGYSLGITGFLMMLSTETLYSLRKHWPQFHLGRMSTWLQMHIFTGLVGPYLVLLHSGWRFEGLAGVLTLVTLIIVISGTIGRYIYTAVPRTPEGIEFAVADLRAQADVAEQKLQALGLQNLAATLATATNVPERGWRLVLVRPLLRWRMRRRLQKQLKCLDATSQAHAAELQQLLTERYQLQMEIQSVESARRLLSWWHTFHIPLSFALFTLAFVHIGAALYYAAFLD